MFGVMKLAFVMSEALAISLDMCSNTYLPLDVVSLMDVVLIELTNPLTRKPTTAIIRMQATPSVTIISTNVNPNGNLALRASALRRREWFAVELMKTIAPCLRNS